MKHYRKELERQCKHETPNEIVKSKIVEYMQNKVLVNEVPTEKNNAELVWGLEFGHPWKNWFTNYNVIFPLKDVKFENLKFPCINNPDAFLSRLYGNYMEYPKKISMGHSMFLKLSEEDKHIISQLKESI